MDRLSSALGAVDLRQEPPPMLIGERLNAQGSRRAKRLVLEGDLEGLVDIARGQVEGGAHCIDVCVATTERSDELEMMESLVKKLSLEITAPLVIDSTDPDVVEAAVRRAPGLPMINSINLEGDGSRFSRLAPVMKKHGVPAVALCIGPDGMAKTPEAKLATARLLYEAGRPYGLRAGQYVFDVLTFTLGTGEAEFADAGKSTLEGIAAVKSEFPGSYTTLGLSNVSFGLEPRARRLLNSAFLYHAVRAGLDSAIVNPLEITPYAQLGRAERAAAEALIYNESDGALAELVSRFGGSDGASAQAEKVDPGLPPGRRANFRIVNRLRDGIESDVAEAVALRSSLPPPSPGKSLEAPQEATHEGAIGVLNEDLLPAMKEVGDKFGAGELILPFVLKSAECMKAAVAELEKYLLKKGEAAKGKLVLGTVYGDVHDIGKNLVRTIFENNGYEVHDLGKQVPVQKFLDKIKEVGADAVGLSALLVSTSKQMEAFVDRARSDGLDVPVLCGGAAINSSYVNRIAKKDSIYGPGVFYCRTMFEGLRTMDRLVSGRDGLLSEWRARLESWSEPERAPAPAEPPRSSVSPVRPPAPPSLAEPVRLGPADVDMGQVWGMLDLKSLFKLSWGVRGRAGAAHQAGHERLLEQWKVRVVREALFEPSAVYGFFECGARGRVLSVRAPGGGTADFEFPRSALEGNLCLADYFGKEDIVAFQAVTAGRRVSSLVSEWDAQGRYSDAYYLHGLAVEFAEAMACWVHERVRREWGIRGGLRYSWGYPACPDVGQHRLVWDLLRPEESGMTLTGAGQIVPEQSTAALVAHHPEAAYFRT